MTRTKEQVKAEIELHWILQPMAMQKPERLARWRKKMDALDRELAALKGADNDRA